MVFFVDWAGWYVIISFSFILSSLPLLLLFLSAAAAGLLRQTPPKKTSYFFFLWKKLKLTDYGTIWNRIEFNGTHYKLFGVFIYSVGGMVGGWKGDFER